MSEVSPQTGVPPYLILLSQYALNFGLIDLRDNLIRYLILLALRETLPSPANTEHIRTRIAAMLNLKELHYPNDVIQTRIDALVTEGRILTEQSGYAIAKEVKQQLESDTIRVAEIHTAVLDDLFSSIGKSRQLSDDQKHTIASALYDFMGNVFAFDGERFARIFIEQHLEITSAGTVGDVPHRDCQNRSTE